MVFKCLFFLLHAIGLVLLCEAQGENLVFKHLNEEDGLNNNVVNCIYKSPKGRMWIATYNGFNSYDGANFTSHTVRKGNNTLPNEVVHELCEDKFGILWGATNNGVFSYNPKSDSYKNYYLKSAKRSLNFFNILCDKNGIIWATGTWSLFKYNAAKDSFFEIRVLANPLDTSNLCFITKNGFLEEPNTNKLWITTSQGLWYYDYKLNSVGNACTEKGNALFAFRNTAALCYGQSGLFWFFDNNTTSIVQFDPKQKKEIKSIPIGKQLPDAKGATLFEDRSHRLWFSSWGMNTLLIEPDKNYSITKLFHRNDDNRSIAGNFIWSAYQDANNTIWLGTLSGISMCNTQNAIYNELRVSNEIKELQNKTIRIVEEEPDGKAFWILSSDTQLYRFNKSNPANYKKLNISSALRNSKGLKPEGIQAIKFINDATLIITNTGIWQTDINLTPLRPYNNLPSKFANFMAIEIVNDADSVLYLNDGRNILYWNKTNSSTRVYSRKNKRTTFSHLCLTANHTLWAITNEKKLATIQHDRLLEIDLKRNFEKESGYFWDLVPDSLNNLWVHNRGAGIYYVNTKTNDVKLYDMTDGLVSNRLHKIALDKSGKLWCMAYDKVSVFIPEAKEFYNFSIKYKMDDLNYENHLTRLQNGNLLGSISDELIEFSTEKLLAKPTLEAPIISLLSVKNNMYYTAENEVLKLGTDENTVRIAFGSFIDNTAYPYDLEYKLNGTNADWISAKGNSEVVFTNLETGNHEFLVRAKGRNNAWVTTSKALRFIIRTPFYKSTWFIIALLTLAALGIYSYYKHRIRQKEKVLFLESKAQLLEKEKALVMYENLKEHLNPHFLFNSLTSLRSLIRIDQNMAGTFLDKMSKVYRYILKNRDNEVVPLMEELKFVQMYIDLQKTRFENGLQINIDISEDHLVRKIAPVTLQNLVENAIKHNTADEESPLVISLFIDDDYLVVQNNLQKKGFVETSNKQGLTNMGSLYNYLSTKPMIIKEENNLFIVKIPLI